jgi:hypothetical protein
LATVDARKLYSGYIADGLTIALFSQHKVEAVNKLHLGNLTGRRPTKSRLRNGLIIPAAILSTMLAVPAFAQTGVPHSADNTTNPNAQNATNPDAQVPPQAPGTAVGDGQPAIPAHQSDSNNASGGSSNNFTTALKDTDITAKVMYALHENNATSGADIHVTTNNGVVTLHGQVQKHHQAMAAVKLARSTEGVREVVNRLAVSKNVNG